MKTPGFVDNIQLKVTQSIIKISWSAPTTKTGEVMEVDLYYIKCTCRLNEKTKIDLFHVKTKKTEIEVSKTNSYIDAFFTVVAEYQGKIGPEVMIGIYIGKTYAQHVTTPD